MKTIALKKGEAALITDRLTRKYLAGFDLAEGVLILGEKPAYFTDARYFFAAKDKIAPAGAEPILYAGTDVLKNYVEKNGIKTLYIDYDRTTVSECERYKTFGAEIKNCSEELMQLRMIKSEEELACVKKACEIIQEAYHNAIKLAKTGVTEKEIADKIRSEIIRLGGEGESFETIVAFGANAAVPHHETGETKLTENTAILVDTGALFNGYCSDLTRMAFFGTPDEEFKNAYDAVLTANLTAFDKIVGGMSGKDADAIAREVLKQRGYGDYFTHSLGHGVGLEIHERPNVSPRSRDNLEENAVFTVEPGVYLNGKFGIRIEDTATIKNGKAERLFTDSKELFVIK
jgi:peptidase M24